MTPRIWTRTYRLKEPGAYTYNDIGGNQTRIALQNIMAQDSTFVQKISSWPVRL